MSARGSVAVGFTEAAHDQPPGAGSAHLALPAAARSGLTEKWAWFTAWLGGASRGAPRGERAERTVKGGAKSAGRGLLWGGGTNDERRGLGCEGGARAGQMGRRGWGTRRAYLRCNF